MSTKSLLLAVIISLSFFNVLGQWDVKSTINVPRPGGGIEYCITFDGSAFYLGYAFGFSPIVKKHAISGNVTVGTEKADIRSLYYFPTSGLLLAYAMLEATPTVAQIYKVDNNNLTFSTYGSPSISSIPIRPFFGILVPSELWRNWEVMDDVKPNAVILRTYNLTGLEAAANTTIAYSTSISPNVRSDTRMHYSHQFPGYVYFNATTQNIYIRGSTTGLEEFAGLLTPPSENSDFLGPTRDGLIWFYDRGGPSIKGFYNGVDCIPHLVAPSASPSIKCTDSTDPYNNPVLSFPYMEYDINCLNPVAKILAYTQYSDVSTKNCTGPNRSLSTTRTWEAKSWNDPNTQTFTQTFQVNQIGAAVDTDYLIQLQERNLNCNDSTAIGFAPGGNGDFSEVIDFPCSGYQLHQADTETQTCPFNRTIIRSWWYDDFCTGRVYYNQTLKIRDSGLPSINIPLSAETIWNQTEPIWTGYPTYYDDCSKLNYLIVSYVDKQTVVGNCTEPDQIERTWTVTDECGLSSSIKQTLIVNYPKVSYPPNYSIECGNSYLPEVAGFPSSEDPNYTYNYTDSSILLSNCPSNIYKIVTRTWNVYDRCGLRSGTQEISVLDTIAPVLNVTEDLTFDCDLIPDVYPLPDTPLLVPATATDLCIGTINVTLVETLPDRALVLTHKMPSCTLKTLNARTTKREWSTIDTCKHSATKEQMIYFRDTKPPYFIKPPQTNVSEVILPKVNTCKLTFVNDEVGNLYVPENVTYADNCDTELNAPKYLGGDISKPECDEVVYRWNLTDFCDNSFIYSIHINITAENPPGSGAHALTSGLLTLLFLWLFNLLNI